MESLKFGKDGLVPAVAQDHETGQVLMLAWMDSTAIEQTLETGLATYWSRSRKEYWVKGKTSGSFQHIVDVRIDCDMDCVLLVVNQTGNACHTGRPTCFYRSIAGGTVAEVA